MKRSTLFLCLAFAVSMQAQDHIPFLISNGGDVQSNGSQTIHLAIGEPVVISSDGTEYIGLGFFKVFPDQNLVRPKIWIASVNVTRTILSVLR
ncbi:MAG: hypothetical protein IPL46_29405 [Saprospiraceae bacterium]|nr:hypothetical protein [Saprospiraceae bacterium]